MGDAQLDIGNEMGSEGMKGLGLKADVITRVVLLIVDVCTWHCLISNHLSVLCTSKTAIPFPKANVLMP